jgi:hypothetical protein
LILKLDEYSMRKENTVPVLFMNTDPKQKENNWLMLATLKLSTYEYERTF